MRQPSITGPLYLLIIFFWLFAIIAFYIGFSRTELAYASAASGSGADTVSVTASESASGSASHVPPSDLSGTPESQQMETSQPSPDVTDIGQVEAIQMDTGQLDTGQLSSSPLEFGQSEAGWYESGQGENSPISELTDSTDIQQKERAYVTTAYFLNIRAESNAQSRILATVKQGTLLMVLDELQNGWLQLADGGFVHGDYAKPAEPDEAEARIAIKSALFHDPKNKGETAAALQQHEGSKASASAQYTKVTNEVISRSGLTKADIEEIFEGTQLVGHGLEEAVLGVEEKYGINAYFTIAVMKLESGNGKSRLAKMKNNLFGLNATGGKNDQAYSFETKADSVHRFGKLISEKYVEKGLTTIEMVGRKYCPANDQWASLVMRIMKSDQKKI